MAFLRRDRSATEPTDQPDEAAPSDDVRSAGPWDSSERDTTDDATYVDLGALRVRGRTGTEIRLQSDGEGDAVAAALVLTSDSAIELRAFAGPRSGGLWDEVRADLLAEVERLDGQPEIVEGLFGTELRARVPMTLPDGSDGFQPSRIVGIDGPRWMLRATFLGQSALEPTDDHVLVETLRDVVVVRGEGPMASREPLLLTIPEQAVVLAEDEVTDPTEGASRPTESE